MDKIIFSFLVLALFLGYCRAQWIVVDSAQSTAWESVFFTDANTGYVAGYLFSPVYYPMIKKTINGGNSWAFLQIPPNIAGYGFVIRSVYFTDINTGFIVGGNAYTPLSNGFILKTSDGGLCWINKEPLDSPIFDNVHFINSSTGFVSGIGKLRKTTDGGESWDSQDPAFTGYLFQFCFTNFNTGYVVGTEGTIRKTKNSGCNWIPQSSGTNLDLYGIGFADDNTGFAVGGNSSLSANIILKTTNGGENWDQVNYQYSPCYFWRVRFISSSICYLLGWCNQIINTSDFGATWYYQTTIPLVNCNFRDCYFTGINTGYLVGDAPSAGQYGYILKTTNGGGDRIPVGIEVSNNENPEDYILSQNYPNPFNPTTNISFSIPKSEHVKLVVYDITGKQVAELVNGSYNAGYYNINFNAAGLSSGIYLYKLSTDRYSETKKMMLVK